MSLNSIISSASAALLKTQYSIGVSNTNTANADNESYARKSFTGSLNTNSAALSTGALTRAANAYLFKTSLSSAASASHAETISAYLQNYELAIGTVDSGDDLSSLIDTFSSSLANLTASVSSSASQSSVVSAASDLANAIRSSSNTIQNLRSQADSDLADAVSDLNPLLKNLNDLNDQIVAANAAGNDTTSLLDERDAALSSLSELVAISTYTQSDGRTIIYAQGGELLVGSEAATLSYTASGSLHAGSIYPSSISGVSLNGRDITSSLTSGKIGALIELRDDTLVAQQDKLDTLAASLIDAVNAISNLGSSYPAANSLTSAIDVAASDSFSASGTTRIAVLDADGAIASSIDLDLSAYSNVADLVTALDSIDGLSASITNGKLTIEAENSAQGVAIGALDSAVGSEAENFSAYFGFNDMLAGADASTISVSQRLQTSPALLPVLTLSEDSALQTGDIGLAASDTSLADALSDALSAKRTLTLSNGNWTGSLESLASNFVSEAAALINDADTNASQTSATRDAVQTNLRNATGVNLDEETAKLTQLQTAYQANAQLISMARELFDTLLNMLS